MVWIRISTLRLRVVIEGGLKQLLLDAISDLKNEKMNDELWPVLLLNAKPNTDTFFVVFIYSRPSPESFCDFFSVVLKSIMMDDL